MRLDNVRVVRREVVPMDESDPWASITEALTRHNTMFENMQREVLQERLRRPMWRKVLDWLLRR